MPDTQPTIGPLRTAPVVQGSVISLRAAGKSKRSIARELGIDRKTVDNVLEVYQADQPNYAETIRKLTTKAFVRIDEVIDKDTDTSKWLLERTALAPVGQPTVNVAGDLSLTQAIGLVPTSPSTASTPCQPSLSSTAPTEAAAKPPGLEMGLSIQTNFSQFSTAELRAELARREAEVIDMPVEASDAGR